MNFALWPEDVEKGYCLTFETSVSNSLNNTVSMAFSRLLLVFLPSPCLSRFLLKRQTQLRIYSI